MRKLIVKNKMQKIKKSNLMKNWIELFESEFSKLALKKIYKKTSECEGLIEDFVH